MFYTKVYHKRECAILMAGTAVLFCIVFLSGCATPPRHMHIDTWAGDSKLKAISRTQDKRSMSCGDPSFDSYVCMDYSDISKLIEVVGECRRWNDLSI